LADAPQPALGHDHDDNRAPAAFKSTQTSVDLGLISGVLSQNRPRHCFSKQLGAMMDGTAAPPRDLPER
jgi:hypothetical protein